jgi:hypothetical protein
MLSRVYKLAMAVMSGLVVAPVFSQTAVVCTGGPCALEVTQQAVRGTLQQIFAEGAKDVTLGQAVARLQTLVTQLSSSSGAALTVTETYSNPASFTDVLADCTPPSTINVPAVTAIVTACTKYNVSAQKMITLQTQFNADMTALRSQFVTLSTAPPTTAGVLANSLQVQALIGTQANLVGRHRGNMELLKIELANLNSSLRAVRSAPVYGK